MLHEFELRKEVAVEATPEQVWEAIATGPGIDSWFLGSTDVEPREGGAVTFTMGEFTTVGRVTVWEPPKRFAYRGGEMPDGTFMAFEYLVEGRDGGSTVVRLVQSGVLNGDWEAEYDGLNAGWELYLLTLSEFIKYFPGQRSISVGGQGAAADQPSAWEALTRGLGISPKVSVGDKIRANIDRLPAIDGVVDYASEPDALGVRTEDALYRFSGRGGVMAIGHHIFSRDVSQDDAGQAWQAWLSRTFA